tara:strand:+ start:4548 stop:5438 length:891 start_codon:yes stop_codon:yes gene_type:complete
LQLIIYIISYPFIIGLSILPHFILYGIADFLYLILYKIIGYRIKVVRNNLRLCFPDKTKEELKTIERSFYRHLCDIFIEMLKALTISKKQVLKRFKFNNTELFNNYLREKRGVVLVCGHYSSWEGMLSIGYHIDGKGYAVYTPLSNKYFEHLFLRSRAKHKIYMGSRYRVLQDIEIHQNNKECYIYGLAADQSPHPKSKTYWRSFMGIEVPVFNGAERIAKQFDLPVVFADINRVKRGYYEINISLITDKPKDTKKNEITDIFTKTLETQILQDPSQYFWTHNRFKHMNQNPKLGS